MNRTVPRLAASLKTRLTTSAAPTKVVALSDQLLPALQLYRRLLRVHRKALPIEYRLMGDDYVKVNLSPSSLLPSIRRLTDLLLSPPTPKAEFRRTKTTENPLHIVGFLSEWKKYLDHHEAQLAEEVGGETGEGKERRIGQKLDPELFEKLSSEQIGQLYELMQATKEVWNEADPAATDGSATEGEGGIPKGQVLPDLGTKQV
ncbi:hypothetical protein P7C70_g6920, partial [Phenoliferia sp. Uapishka_3]